MLRLTPVVRNLIFINVIVFVFQLMTKEGETDLVSRWLALYNIQTQAFKPYQLFTYMFCHQGFGHIFWNMLGLVFFGPILEEFWGQKRFLIFYIACGIGAGVFSILMDVFLAHPPIVMIGASGAVYGVMTAFGVIFPNMELRLLFLPISFKAKYLVMVLGSLAIYNGLRPSAGDNVAHLAHLGGIVVAIILIQIWRGRGSSGY
jgi:membrane associated rhomboid family serine protease